MRSQFPRAVLPTSLVSATRHSRHKYGGEKRAGECGGRVRRWRMHLSPGGKWGRVRSLKPSGQRRPETDCCPTHATICAMLMGDPLLPHWLMISGELWCCSVFMHTCTHRPVSHASSQTLPSSRHVPLTAGATPKDEGKVDAPVRMSYFCHCHLATVAAPLYSRNYHLVKRTPTCCALHAWSEPPHN